MRTPYDAAIFFDNVKDHVTAMMEAYRNRVTGIHVGGDSHDIPPIVPFTDEQFREFYEGLGTNTYLTYAREAVPDGDTYDSESGIQDAEFAAFETWLRNTMDIKKRALFLDWDRTITVFEGFAVLHVPGKKQSFTEVFPNVRMEDCLLYLCGGRERLAMLRLMFTMARAENVDIYIVTNNSACSYQVFRDIVNGLFREVRIVCSGDAPYSGNKVEAVRMFLVHKRKSLQYRKSTLRSSRRGKSRKALSASNK